MKLATTLTILATVVGLSMAASVATSTAAKGCETSTFNCDPCCEQPKLHRVRYHFDEVQDRDERCLCNEIN